MALVRRLVAMACGLVLAVLVLPAGGTSAAVPGLGFTQTGCEGHSDSVARLYTAGLGRRPEQPGFEFWFGEYTSGRWRLPSMATFFTQSNEFGSRYGNLDHEGFVRQLYRNVLGREGEGGGVAYWTGQLNLGQTRGAVLLRFAESPENIANSGTAQPLLGAYNDGLPGRWTCGSLPVQPSAPPTTVPPTALPVAAVPTTTVPPTTVPRECDPNYSGCVPIASDVDCLGGSGNGPAYVAGPVQVIGVDIYDLDGDSDGIGCE